MECDCGSVPSSCLVGWLVASQLIRPSEITELILILSALRPWRASVWRPFLVLFYIPADIVLLVGVLAARAGPGAAS